jgi:steroid 5-alpha reductase family enzyme
LICLGGYKSQLHIWLGLLSPLFVFTLLVNVSGINILEKTADKHWGDDPEYKAYKARTPVLIPYIGRAGDAPF